MAKAKITFVVEVEYEIDPTCYPTGSTINDMLDIDLTAANDDPFLMMDAPDAKWSITGQLVG